MCVWFMCVHVYMSWLSVCHAAKECLRFKQVEYDVHANFLAQSKIVKSSSFPRKYMYAYIHE
jgi:hypothetical protein